MRVSPYLVGSAQPTNGHSQGNLVSQSHGSSGRPKTAELPKGSGGNECSERCWFHCQKEVLMRLSPYSDAEQGQRRQFHDATRNGGA